MVIVGVGLATLLIFDRADGNVERRTLNVERSESDIVPQTISDKEAPIIKTEKTTDRKARKISKAISKEDKIEVDQQKTPNNISSADQTNETSVETKKEQAVPEIKTLITYFTASVTEGCAPLEVAFTNHSENAASYSWSFGEDVANVVYTFTQAGEHTVILTATNQDGIQQSYSEIITVHPKPVAEFIIEDGQVYNYSVDAIEYSWGSNKKSIASTEFQPELDEEWLKSNELEHILLTVKNREGCVDTMSALLPLPPPPSLLFPSAFSPNPSGPSSGYYNLNEPGNEIFHPKFTEEPIKYNLSIYNRVGELIFETNDIYIGWDGYYREAPLLRGVYVWKCTGKWKDGTFISQQGDITALWSSNK
jgi:PKD repeat protein